MNNVAKLSKAEKEEIVKNSLSNYFPNAIYVCHSVRMSDVTIIGLEKSLKPFGSFLLKRRIDEFTAIGNIVAVTKAPFIVGIETLSNIDEVVGFAVAIGDPICIYYITVDDDPDLSFLKHKSVIKILRSLENETKAPPIDTAKVLSDMEKTLDRISVNLDRLVGLFEKMPKDKKWW